jgi:starch phosphorylase
MAHLSVLASHKVNGVSALHSQLMVDTIFSDFVQMFPKRFCNKTNGITPRRWLSLANQPLASLIDSRIGPEWRGDLMQLDRLHALAEDPGFQMEFRLAKQQNKQRLADFMAHCPGVMVDPHSLFDVQAKRMHEYKRQLLNVLHVITRYHRILDQPQADWVPRTVIFAGKAASAYYMAKLVIRLINDVARVVNNDPRIAGQLKVITTSCWLTTRLIAPRKTRRMRSTGPRTPGPAAPFTMWRAWGCFLLTVPFVNTPARSGAFSPSCSPAFTQTLPLLQVFDAAQP